MKIDTTSATRLSKAVLVAAAAAWSFIAGVDNVFDYSSNFQFVRHVLEMDTTFPGNAGMWRAVRLPILHHVAYALIIVTELAVGVLAGIGALRMAAARHNTQQRVHLRGVFAKYFFHNKIYLCLNYCFQSVPQGQRQDLFLRCLGAV